MKIENAMRLTAIIALLCACTVSYADSKVTAIKGGDLYTITSGIIKNGTILIEDGKISDIGQDLSIPKDANIIDAKGKVVMPGFVTAATSSMPAAGYGAERIADELNPYHYTLSLALASGVTSIYAEGRSSSPLGGTNAVIKPSFGDIKNMLVAEPVVENIRIGPRQWMAKNEFELKMGQARKYLQELTAHQRAKDKGEAPKRPSGIDAYLRLLQRERSGRVSASSAGEILALLEIVDEFPFQLVIDGGTEAWTVAEEIAARGATVIITPREKRRPDEDVSHPTGSNLENAAILKKAGVKFAIVPATPNFSTGGIAGRDLMTLPMEAAFAVSGGLDEQTALEAITITPAEILGIADRLGSLQVGKDADIVILDGHPFHYNTFVQQTFVNGKLLYDKGKSTFFSHIRSYDDKTNAAFFGQTEEKEADALPPEHIRLD